MVMRSGSAPAYWVVRLVSGMPSYSPSRPRGPGLCSTRMATLLICSLNLAGSPSIALATISSKRSGSMSITRPLSPGAPIYRGRRAQVPSAVFVGDLLPRFDGDRQPVLGRRQRAGREVGVGARQVGGAVEVKQQRAVGGGRRQLPGAVGRVRRDAGGRVGGQDHQAARPVPGERGEGEVTPVQGELQLAGSVVNVLEAVDDRADRRRPRLGERDVARGDRPARVGRVRGGAVEGGAQRGARVPGAD